MIVVDTGPLVALVNSSDADHQRCAEWIEKVEEPLLVPNTVPGRLRDAVGRLGGMDAGADLTAAVVAQWRQAGPALARVHRDELRLLTDAEALAAAEELLDLVWLVPPPAEVSGLVEQQRLFARART